MFARCGIENREGFVPPQFIKICEYLAYGHMKGNKARNVYALALLEIAYGMVNVKPC